MTDKPPARRRNAVATRLEILASARSCFARFGYDGAGLREIAKGAGVTAMLVKRYFGSKEELFAEVIAETMATPTILAPDNLTAPNLGKVFASALVGLTETSSTPLDGFLIMLHSASSERAAAIGREQIERFHHKTLESLLSGQLTAERAALILSLISGFQVMRQMMGLKALAEADPEALAELLAPLFQRLIDGQ